MKKKHRWRFLRNLAKSFPKEQVVSFRERHWPQLVSFSPQETFLFPQGYFSLRILSTKIVSLRICTFQQGYFSTKILSLWSSLYTPLIFSYGPLLSFPFLLLILTSPPPPSRKTVTMGVKSLGTDLPTLEYAAHPSHLSVEYKHALFRFPNPLVNQMGTCLALVRFPNPLGSQMGNLSSPSQVSQP